MWRWPMTKALCVPHKICRSHCYDSQLQVSEGEKSYTCNQFSLSSERPMIGFCPGAEFGPAKRWSHYHYAELAKQLIDEGYQVVLFGSAKDHEAGNEILAALNTEQQAWCRNPGGGNTA